MTSRLCYFLKTRAIQGVPFGYPDYIELAQYMINVSFADPWWHVTARDQARGYISRVASTLESMLLELYEPAHADPVFRRILRNVQV